MSFWEFASEHSEGTGVFAFTVVVGLGVLILSLAAMRNDRLDTKLRHAREMAKIRAEAGQDLDDDEDDDV